MIEAPVFRRGLFALMYDLGRGRFQGDLSAGNLKAARRQARRFARTPLRGEEQYFSVLDALKPIRLNLNPFDHLRGHAQLVFFQKFAEPITVDKVDRNCAVAGGLI